jgi:DNA-binding HxlR family transcriptional regulator
MIPSPETAEDPAMPRTRHHRGACSPGCAVEATLRLIDGKWKGVILYHLMDGTLRFNEIRRRLANVTQRMLTNQLREMEADGLIARKVYAEGAPEGGVQPDRARALPGAYHPRAEGLGRPACGSA